MTLFMTSFITESNFFTVVVFRCKKGRTSAFCFVYEVWNMKFIWYINGLLCIKPITCTQSPSLDCAGANSLFPSSSNTIWPKTALEKKHHCMPLITTPLVATRILEYHNFITSKHCSWQAQTQLSICCHASNAKLPLQGTSSMTLLEGDQRKMTLEQVQIASLSACGSHAIPAGQSLCYGA